MPRINPKPKSVLFPVVVLGILALFLCSASCDRSQPSLNTKNFYNHPELFLPSHSYPTQYHQDRQDDNDDNNGGSGVIVPGGDDGGGVGPAAGGIAGGVIGTIILAAILIPLVLLLIAIPLIIVALIISFCLVPLKVSPDGSYSSPTNMNFEFIPAWSTWFGTNTQRSKNVQLMSRSLIMGILRSLDDEQCMQKLTCNLAKRNHLKPSWMMKALFPVSFSERIQKTTSGAEECEKFKCSFAKKAVPLLRHLPIINHIFSVFMVEDYLKHSGEHNETRRKPAEIN